MFHDDYLYLGPLSFLSLGNVIQVHFLSGHLWEDRVPSQAFWAHAKSILLVFEVPAILGMVLKTRYTKWES